MERVRKLAAEAGVPATALIRPWVVDRLDANEDEAVVSVADLKRLIAERSHRRLKSSGNRAARPGGQVRLGRQAPVQFDSPTSKPSATLKPKTEASILKQAGLRREQR